MTLESRSVVWVDAGGSQTITRINSDGGFAGPFVDLLAVTNADWLQEWESVLSLNPSPSATSLDYLSVKSVAIILFTTTGVGLVSLRIPAPKLSIFLADGKTVDFANTDVVSLVNACVGILANEAGDTAVSYVAGYLQ